MDKHGVFRISLFCLVLMGCGTQSSPNDTPVSNEPKIVKSEKWNEAHITKNNFRGIYPFTVDKGILRCEFNNGLPLIYFGANGSMYALNGSAKSASPKLPSVDKIWMDNPTVVGHKLSLDDVIRAGLVLCEK